jgi:PPK2 family polyphosphate:nucleotide phosphotransferase
LLEPVDSPYRVPSDATFRLGDVPTQPPDDPGSKECERRLEEASHRLAELQPILYAHDHRALLLIFQAMDAAGKDGTIRAVLTGVNPAGCQVHSFKAPNAEELDHDFLWRTTCRLPRRGMIGVFNRSYYEEVLVVRVHPAFLNGQHLPQPIDHDTLWGGRYQSILDHEQHLARNGTVILKFFLNVSRDEQRKRFLSRLDEPEKNWKFNPGDVEERAHWKEYMRAYEDALRETSRPWAPWYAIPADDKPYMRMRVAEVVTATVERFGLHYPEVRDADRARFTDMRKRLADE